MPKHANQKHAADWIQLLCAHTPVVRQQVRVLVETHRPELASHFYAQMMQNPAASRFLSHDEVHNRLHKSMQAWLLSVFSVGPDDALLPLVVQQTKIGEVHARIDLPIHLVLRGARTMKEKMHALLQDDAVLDAQQCSEAGQFVAQVIDLAMEIMSQAYAHSHDRSARAKESYRLFAVSQNVSTERERRRAALLDWENQLMFDHAVGLESMQLPRLGSSEFGLWFRHKGAYLFQGTVETDAILRTIRHIDDNLLPVFALPGTDNHSQRVLRLRELREQTRRVAFHLDALFEQNRELESGRDVLTRLLNRKFLSVVLGKEVHLARESGNNFAALAIDIDHFKQVNDTYGHEAGDMVLQQMAAVFTNYSRGGDYLFRLGGEEFLLLLVDTQPEEALQSAEKLCQQVASEPFHLLREHSLQVTISIGVAMFNGHPDYQSLLRRADAALYRAKNSGRNRVVLAEDA